MAVNTTVQVTMPQMGDSVTEGTVLEWHKQEGDAVDADETIVEWAKQPGEAVQVDETIVEISTDKVDMELPAPASGTLTEILAAEGETVHPGQVLARITVSEGAAPPPPAPAEAPPAPAGDGAPTSAPPPADVADGARVSPVARRAAAAEGVDLGRVEGSGPGGRVTKADVLAAAGNGAATATPPAPVAAPAGAQPLKGAAAMLARYMDESRS